MPRTTLNIDSNVLRELKKRQRKERKPLGQMVSELLARALAEDEDSVPAFRWETAQMGEPLVDLADKDALWATLDRGRQPM